MGLHCVFPSDPAVSSAIFVREKGGNLISSDPDKSELSIEVYILFLLSHFAKSFNFFSRYVRQQNNIFQ